MAGYAFQSSIEWAYKYVQRRWGVVPVPYRAKGPVLRGWQQLRVTEVNFGRYFREELQNVGVLLGEHSSRLIDVDLDHRLAIELATHHLPVTSAIFGRCGKRRSHWLYYASRPVATRQVACPISKWLSNFAPRAARRFSGFNSSER